MLSLLSLPYEVLSTIVESISFDDYYNLGLSCKSLSFLLEEEQICKLVVQMKIPHSHEAKEAKDLGTGYARSFRRAAKRYGALISAVPFVVVTVGFCDAFLYCKGVLCYTIDETVRILSPHTASSLELVVSIPQLIKDALYIGADNNIGNFLVLYYSDGIISCLYKTSGSDSTGWLIVFHLESETIFLAHELTSTDKIFVRHNANFLYYGTHSELGADGYKKWVINGYQFSSGKWFAEKIHLPEMVGSEIGSTICFEFYDGFFYALSNQTSFEVEEIDWTSFYHCVRFPLDSPSRELLELTENETMWRRQHREGPIDDRWTVLRLDMDDGSEKLNIVESRREWYMGSSRSQRTYYTTPVIFPDQNKNKDKDIENSHLLAASAAAISNATLTNSPWAPAAVSTANSASPSSASNADTLSKIPMGSTSIVPVSNEKVAAISNFPNAQLAKLLMPDDNPNHIEAPTREPKHTHPGNDGSAQTTYTLAKSRIRAYHTCCQSFMDVVDDPLSSDTYGTQRLRLRSGTRHLRQPLRDANGLLRDPSSDLDTALKELYDVPEIQYWPKKQDSQILDPHNDDIYKLLNPPTHLGDVNGVADERSIVYSTGPAGSPQALIFISFDPATKLEGLKHWGGLNPKGLGEGPHIDGRAAAGTSIDMDMGLDHDNMVYVDTEYPWFGVEKPDGGNVDFVDVDEADRTVVIDSKGKGKADSMSDGSFVHVTSGMARDCPMLDSAHHEGFQESANEMLEVGVFGRKCTSSWIWKDQPMHIAINLGFYFGRPKKDMKNSLIDRSKTI